MHDTLEERLRKVEDEQLDILRDINSLKGVEEKLDDLNAIAHEIKNSSASVIKKIESQEKFLKEIQASADFRRRESVNSVREIKNEMGEMKIHGDISFQRMLDTIINSIKENKEAQIELTKELKRQFETRFYDIETKISSYVRITWFGAILSIISILTTLSLLYTLF